MSSAKYPTWGSPYYRCSGSHRPPWEHRGAVCGEQIWKQSAALFSYIIIEAFFGVSGTCNKYATIKGYAQRKCIPLC